MTSRLPLRLWAAPHLEHQWPKTKPFVVEVAPSVCAVLTMDGVAALVIDVSDTTTPLPALPLALAAATLATLQRSLTGAPSWSASPRDHPALVADAAIAELIVNSLRGYWSRQVREPSVRGFLSILSKQFAASHLYLFELLQNAVDEGATSVRVARTSHSSLSVAHDGRRFAPLDVVGLSSVGLSTKAGRSAIGCMGIGFKAVFKRWSSVTVSDGTWGFRFERGVDDKTLPPHAWVLLPRWVPPPTAPLADPSWCRFELARPTASGWSADLRGLPRGAPVLLGRAALQQGAKRFALDWDGRTIAVERESERIIKADGARWLFITAPVTADRAAAAAYKAHTKRAAPSSAEVCLFVELDAESRPIPPKRALLHVVLPTAVRLRVSAYVHGPFLTSVDRTSVQDDDAWNKACLATAPTLIARYCEWVAAQTYVTAAGVRAAHAVVVGALREGAPVAKTKQRGKAKHNARGGPAPRRPPLLCSLLGTPASAEPLLRSLRSAKVIPVWAPTDDDICASPSDGEVRFVRAADAVRVPPPFLRRLSPAFLQRWLGRLPVIATSLDPLFARLRVDDLATARRGGRLQSLLHAAGESAPALDAELVAAFAEAAAEEEAAVVAAAVATAKLKKQAQQRKQRGQPAIASDAAMEDYALRATVPTLPTDWKRWPIVLSSTGQLAPASKLIVPEEAFDELPRPLQAALLRCASGPTPHPDLLIASRGLGVPAPLVDLARRLFTMRPPPAAAIVTELTAWAQRRDDPSIVSAVLLEDGRLVPAAHAHLGSAMGGAALETLGLPCASKMYGVSARYFLERAGVRATVGLTFSREVIRRPTAALRKRLPPGTTLELRSSKKTVALPHGLGELSSKEGYAIIDADFAPGWTNALRKGARLVAHLMGGLDLSASGLHPTRATLVWLPPGQAGSTSADLGPARWIERLKRERWVPTVPAGEGALHRYVAPANAALRRSQSNRHLSLAALPASFLGSKLAKLLNFGTAPPPSAMSQLRDLAEGAARGGGHAPTAADASVVWRAVALGALSSDERMRARAYATRSALLPAADGVSLVALERCVRAPTSPLARALCDCGYLVDLAAPSHALADAAVPLAEVLGLTSASDSASPYVFAATRSFLRWIGTTASPLPGSASFAAASTALSRVLHAELRADGSLPPGVRGALRLCVRRVGDTEWRWHKPADPTQARMFLADDAVQRALLRDQLAKHGFLELGVLNQVVGAGSEVDNVLLSALGVARLSDRTRFSTAVQVSGARSNLALASIALREVLTLLDDNGAPPRVSRVKRLERHFILPGVVGANSGPLDAAWTSEITSGGGASEGGAEKRDEVLVCGANEDYACALQDEVVRALLPRHAEWDERRPSQALHLITFLEAPKKLTRYAKKRFNVHLDLHIARNEEEEEEGGQGSEQFGSANPGADADAMLAAFDARLAELGGGSTQSAAPPLPSFAPPPPPPPPPPAGSAAGSSAVASGVAVLPGAGRGVAQTLPAWMSAGGVVAQVAQVGRAEVPAASESAAGSATASAAAASGVEAGRGMGATLPAWMTDDASTERVSGRAAGESAQSEGSAAAAKRPRDREAEDAAASSALPMKRTRTAVVLQRSPHLPLLQACEGKHSALRSCAAWAEVRRVVLQVRVDAGGDAPATGAASTAGVAAAAETHSNGKVTSWN